VIESLTWVELPAVYYALRRGADYHPDGSSEENTHISYALRVDALPAFVMTPDASEVATRVISYKEQAPPLAVDGGPMIGRSRIIDGLVIDPNAEYQAGPNAVILPPR
jgi:hypothetical protein